VLFIIDSLAGAFIPVCERVTQNAETEWGGNDTIESRALHEVHGSLEVSALAAVE